MRKTSPAQLAAPAEELVGRELRHRLSTQWRPGQRVPPIRQLAKQLGYGETSTFRAVRRLVRAGVLASHPRRGTFVTDKIIHSASADSRALRLARVLLLTLQPDRFILRMLESFEAALAEQAQVVRTQIERSDLSRLGAQPGDALVLINPDPVPDIVMRPDQVLVAMNTALETPIAAAGGFDVVSVDQEQGGFLAGQHLRHAGCSEVCYIARSGSRRADRLDETVIARLRGFERGWGRVVPEDHWLIAKSYDEISAARELPRYLAMNPRPDGIFAASDELAMGAVFGLSAHGLDPGRDYQIVGFDGQQRGRDLTSGPLSTVDIPGREMGRTAAQLLLERWADPNRPVRRLFLGCTFYQGATTVLFPT